MPRDQTKQQRQDRFRTITLLCVFGVMLGLGMLYTSVSRWSAESLMRPTPTTAGRLSARLPEDWAVDSMSRDGLDRLYAAIEQEESLVQLTVDLQPLTEKANGRRRDNRSLLSLAASRRGDVGTELVIQPELYDAPRPIQVGDAEGIVATYGYLLGESLIGGLRGGQLLFFRTIAVARTGDDVVIIEVERHGEWDGRDTLLLRAVAGSVSIDGNR